ncbi:MAG: glycerol-3-phosphate 1-O-acyltransferase PlsY [Anaerolineae bacterium]|jgi:glycerol-3-phosphate acyltransferase PlsY
MTTGLLVVVAALMAYLLGSFPAGYLLGRLWGVNVLEWGSGRTGGTNVLRSAGPLPALLTGALDVGKGALAVWLAGQVVPGSAQAMTQVLAGAAVILGHNHSVFLGFRGGAGVGTSLGALSVIYWPAAVALLLTLLAVVAITRYASVGSLTVSTLMPIILLGLGLLGVLPVAYFFYGLLAWIIIVLAHRPNIRRLIQGTERRLGERGSPQSSP